MNFNITVPEGTTNHGNPKLLCTPAKWYDYIIFFFSNYVAHAATVVPVPGQDLEASLFHIMMALCLPGSAIVRSVTMIARRAAIETKDPLKRARRAGALCVVLRKSKAGQFAGMIPFSPSNDEETAPRVNADESSTRVDDEDAIQKGLEAPAPREKDAEDITSPEGSGPWWNPLSGYCPIPEGSQIHGEYWLHDDYYLALVPPVNMPDLILTQPELASQPGIHHSETHLSSSQNLLKLFISLLQSMWAVITIYRARGDQIQQYGFAAFGLTVAPYATMSIINTIANMLTPEYPTLFVLRTPLLKELEDKKLVFFSGALDVAERPLSQDAKTSRTWTIRLGDTLDWLLLREVDLSLIPGMRGPGGVFVLGFFLSLVPLAIVGGLSGFRWGESTQMQRGFTMSWLVLGAVYGLLFGDDRVLESAMPRRSSSKLAKVRRNGVVYGLLIGYVFLVPFVGGLVMVGQMIREFGICMLLRE